MSEELDFENTIHEDLLKGKISAYQGVKKENNLLLLGYLALNGPSLPYVIFKFFKDCKYYKDTQYPTVYRRIKGLIREGYVTEAGKRKTRRGKRTEETRYGLTLKGWIASWALDNVRKNVLNALKFNLNTAIPENWKIYDTELKVRKLMPGLIEFLNSIYSDEEIYAMTTAIFLGYLKSNAYSIDQLMLSTPEELIQFIKPITSLAVIEEKKLLPQGIEKSINLLSLLDNPEILDFTKKITPTISRISIKQVNTFATYYIISTEINRVLNELGPQEKASKRVEKWITVEFPKLIQQYHEALKHTEDSQ